MGLFSRVHMNFLNDKKMRDLALFLDPFLSHLSWIEEEHTNIDGHLQHTPPHNS
jgi:hypothetical protein